MGLSNAINSIDRKRDVGADEEWFGADNPD